MMKKFLAIACCCAPFSAAVAATTIINPATNPGSNVLDELTLGAGDAALVQSGNGMALGNGGLSADSVYVGMNSTGATNGQLFVETTAAADYSIRSDGNISVASLLQVLSGHSLSIGAKTTGSIASVSLGSVMVGSSATETGGLTIQDAASLTTGNITSWGPLSVTGGKMTVNGTLFSRTGGVNINLTDELFLSNDLITDGGATSEINATGLSASSFQNKNGSVTVNLATGDAPNVTNGPLTLTGSLENSGTLLKITGVSDADITGTVKNDSNNGTMIIVAENFSVTGGSDAEASFVNKGDLQMTVSGETSLAYGFDLSAMTEENTFSLNTGTLNLGDNPDQLLQVFSNNKLKSFELIVQNGGIAANNIINGQSSEAANMTITTGDDITANLIQNYGADLIIGTKEDSTGDISITSADTAGTSIVGAAGYTEIIADGTLSAGGAVTNSAQMFLSGNEVELNSVANTGNLTINAQTDDTGKIHLSGDVANSAGSTTISARQVAIDGTVTTNAGTTTIKGSDVSNGGFVEIGGIQALGGVTNLDSLIGGATINNSLIVSGGAFNTGLSLFNLVATRGAQIGGDLTFSGTDATAAGDMNVANKGSKFTLTATNGQVKVDGSVIATENDVARSGALVADLVEVGEDVTAANKGWLIFGDALSNTLKVTGDVTANDNGTVEFYSANATVGSLSGNGRFIMHGDSVVANVGEIDVGNGIWYDGTSPESGMIVNGTESLTLQTTNAGQDITVEKGISIANVKNADNEPVPTTLNLNSANDVNISGAVNVNGTLPTGDGAPVASALNVNATNAVEFDGQITTTKGGAVNVTGKTIQTAAIDNGAKSLVSLGNTSATSVETTELVKNAGTLDIVAQGVTMSALTATDGVATIAATDQLNADVLDVSGGIVNMSGDSIKSSSMTLSGGSTKLSSDTITVSGDVNVTSGNLAQGGTVGTLILADNGTFKAANLNVSNGKLLVDGGNVTYEINNTATFRNGIETTAGSATVDAKNITIGGKVKNAADLTLKTQNNLGLGVVENSGSLVLDAGTGNITATSLDNTGGTAKITAQNMALTGALTSNGVLYQNYAGVLSAGDMNITSTNHTLTTSNLTVAGINQYGSSKMVVKSSDVTVNGSIMAKDLRFQANPAGDWLNVKIANNVSGGVDFVGLEHMTIGGNYTFNNDSMLHAAILPQPGVVLDSTTYNYWSTVSLNNDNTLGQITNATDGTAAPLISLTGQFVYDVTSAGSELSGGALVSPQIGIDIFDMVDSGSAIWLLHSDSSAGLAELNDKLRNLNVNFCNADGSRCFRYFDSSIAENAEASQTPSNLPAYLTVRDIDEDGVTDSIYIVFDSRFGGPVEVFKIQPIVDRVDDHTDGEHDAAGALDDMIEGGLKDAKFNNRSPIEAIPVAFKGTNLENLANELYKRMEQYTLNRDGTGLARFSRLVQPREIEQLVASVALEEHTFYRDFEDHMFDEFIWNRHRNLEKAWVDVDYGVFSQDASDSKRVSGDRFSIVGGYDWQYSPTLILGFAGHVSHMSADDTDAMDLSYIPGKKVDGHVSYDVADTDIGVGAYLMKILGLKTRLYGNAFADLHLLDVSRDQNFVSHIDGSGTAFSLITEWGFLHDWLNQYIVGNLYARAGYNFGFSVTEKASGDDYMQLESDGYLIFTPGYSLIAQKRFYPSSWFQIRPYVSAGVEYDVAGTPDYAKFKFGPAKSFTKYDVEIDPLWANIGGGVEMLSVSGFQVGLDYRYQYNNNLQLHKVRLSGSYRF